MEIPVIKYTGEATGRKVALPKEVFGIVPNDHVIYLAIKAILANRRQGTHKGKERGEVAGSTRKIKPQKGTGSARAGNIKSPLFRGGGVFLGQGHSGTDFALFTAGPCGFPRFPRLYFKDAFSK